jgi:hypothetical protein
MYIVAGVGFALSFENIIVHQHTQEEYLVRNATYGPFTPSFRAV